MSQVGQKRSDYTLEQQAMCIPNCNAKKPSE